MSKKKVAYITSPSYVALCNQHPKTKNRAVVVDSLIKAYNLLNEVFVVAPTPVLREDLMLFHSEDYVNCLEKIQNILECEMIDHNKNEDSCEETFDLDELEEEFQISDYGFGYDCPVFKRMFDYAKMVVGATVTAADILINGEADVAINLHGGWHHAHVDEAAGFCYVNDIVIGVLKLTSRFKRVLYIDLDVHHGDGVEEAFRYSKNVLTFSLHKHSNGYFPGTGAKQDVGKGSGKYFSVNVPLKDGIDDIMYYFVFHKLFNQVVLSFEPDVFVVQCGADSLSLDPLGGFNLTSQGIIGCVKDICACNKPVMILGGGGYNLANTSRCWTQLTAMVVGKEISGDIPDHDYMEHYGPDFSVYVASSNRKNENTDAYIEDLLEHVTTNIIKMKIKKENSSKTIDNKENVTLKSGTEKDFVTDKLVKKQTLMEKNC
ncbi:histone deacetylase 8-like [Hydractinia symbiolongicarpus]|uniref:histone deacetylase 8-like n=1 Tax=Hydractinia symbiolongicarpus TaxID=13093 RepID=UPI0025514469|nr:histone deacetylase 8-like [Hydractinia symbiolongicarpus]